MGNSSTLAVVRWTSANVPGFRNSQVKDRFFNMCSENMDLPKRIVAPHPKGELYLSSAPFRSNRTGIPSLLGKSRP
jgi:hypothetical protein